MKTDLLSKSGLFYLKAFILTTLFLIALMCLCYAEIDMEAIKYIESRGNPLAYNKHSQAMGLYQITPICLKDYNQQNRQNLGVEALFSPSECHRVAKWYLGARIPLILQNWGIPITVDNLLWAYNAGPGMVRKGIMPEETRNYISKYHKLARLQ